MHRHTNPAMGDRNTIVVTICKVLLIALFLSLFICFRYLSFQNSFKIHLETVWNETSSLAIFAKAIRFAIKYGEFYDQRPVVQGWIDNGIEGPSGKALTPERKAELEAMLAKMPSATSSADELMEAAEARLGELEAGGAASWTEPTAAVSAPYEHGCVARGYVSVIDGSPQPYGLELPPSLPADGGKVPLYVWLHGRGAQSTDLHFIRERMRSRGQMAPLDGGIVLHPFGRQCIGYKSAGAIDVLHAIEAVKEQYPIDVDRIVLYGFSMGGAGSWSIGAHYPDLWAVVQPGAGFAETFLFYDDEGRPEDGPSGEFGEPDLPPPEGPIDGRVHTRDLPDYEIKLWGEGDATAYTRSLFNVPVLAYSGENDRQLQASRVMVSTTACERLCSLPYSWTAFSHRLRCAAGGCLRSGGRAPTAHHRARDGPRLPPGHAGRGDAEAHGGGAQGPRHRPGLHQPADPDAALQQVPLAHDRGPG